MNSTALDTTLAARALAGPGSDAPEGPLREAMRLAEATDYVRAAERSARLLAGGVTDVRALAYFLFGVFLEQGPGALPPILDLLAEMFGPRWDTARPKARKSQLAVGASSWLVRTIVQHIDFHAAQDDATFRAWRGAEPAPLAPVVQPKMATLRAVLAVQPSAERVTEMLSELEARVRAHFSRSIARKAPEPPPPVVAVPFEGEPSAAVERAPDREDADTSPLAPARLPAGLDEPSPALQLLLRKLSAFEHLVGRGDLVRAGIAAGDIQQVLAHFDPKLYFPRLFTSFFRLLAANAAEVGHSTMAADEGTVRALEQLYAVDLDAFVEP